ncbi:MAG: hypothetical protein EZS28_025030, partial [Streblomastix strix]
PSSSSPTTGVIESQSAPIVVSGPKSKISLVGELPAIKESKTKLRQQKYQEEKERQQQQQQMYQRGIRGKENPMQYQGRGRQMNQQRTPGNRRPDFTPPKGPNPWGRGQGSDVNNQPLFNLAPMQQWESADYYNQLNYNFMMGSGQAGGLGGWGINIQNEQQQQMRDLDELERQLLQQEEEIRQQNLIYEQQMLLQQQQENAQGLMASDTSQQFAPSPQLLSNPTQPIQFTQSNPGQNTSVILNPAQTQATAPITSSVTSKALSAKAKAFVPGFLKKKDPEPKKEVEQKLDETGDVK